MRKIFFGTVIFALSMVFAVGAGSMAMAQDAASKEVTIGFSIASSIQERWIREKSHLVNKAKALGAKVIVNYAKDNAQTQEGQCDEFINKTKVDVLIIMAHDGEKAAAIVDKAHAAGIKVVAYDRLIKNCDLDYYLSFDNVKVGEFEAQGVVDVVNKGNFVYIGGSPLDNNAKLVKEGSMKVLQPLIDKGDIKVVYDKFTDNWSPDVAYSNVAQALKDNNNDIQAIVCANDGTASGAIRALQEVGLAGKVPVSGQDAEIDACRKVAEGLQAVTVYKPGKVMAEKAAEIAVALAKGEKADQNNVTANGKIDVPSFLLAATSVTKANLMDTVIADGYQTYEDVYVNVPEAQRPVKK